MAAARVFKAEFRIRVAERILNGESEGPAKRTRALLAGNALVAWSMVRRQLACLSGCRCNRASIGSHSSQYL